MGAVTKSSTSSQFVWDSHTTAEDEKCVVNCKILHFTKNRFCFTCVILQIRLFNIFKFKK